MIPFILRVVDRLPAVVVGTAIILAVLRVLDVIGLSWLWISSPIWGPIAIGLVYVWFRILRHYATTTSEERADAKLTRLIQRRAAGELEIIFGEDVTR